MTARLDQATLVMTRSIDGSGEMEIRANGDVILTPGVRYDSLRIEYTVRGANNELLKRDDSIVDTLTACDNRATFAHSLYIKFPLVPNIRKINICVISRTYSLSDVLSIDLTSLEDVAKKGTVEEVQRMLAELPKAQ